MFANNALLGGGVRRLGFGLENKERSKGDQRHYLAFDGKLGHHCTCRPEQHGEEMLSLVSGVLSKSHDPILVAMAIEGLVSLCRAEVGSKQFFFHFKLN